jgi:glycosyltransferase involved in cell wall biosynthesis
MTGIGSTGETEHAMAEFQIRVSAPPSGIPPGCCRMPWDRNSRLISGVVLRQPGLADGVVRKGVVICNFPRIVASRIPDLTQLYWLVQRRGWRGFSVDRAADIQLVDDIPAQRRWNRFVGILRAVRRWTPWPDVMPRPAALPFGNADFVDTEAFTPDRRFKTYDVIMIARWSRFKKHQLMVDAFRVLKNHGAEVRGVMFGDSGLPVLPDEIDYRNQIAASIRREKLPVDLPGIDPSDTATLDFTKQSMAAWINASRVGLVLSKVEAINRFKMECLSCDVPVIVCADACWCVKKHVTPRTGLLVDRRPDALASAILAIRAGAKVSPRDYILENTGIDRAMAALQRAVDDLDAVMGLDPAPIARYDGRNNTLNWHDFVAHLGNEVAAAIARLGVERRSRAVHPPHCRTEGAELGR